jgi:hypothetical protein
MLAAERAMKDAGPRHHRASFARRSFLTEKKQMRRIDPAVMTGEARR